MKRTPIEYIESGTKGRLVARSNNPEYDIVTSVSIDSRDIPEGCLFFCIIGERTDAHRYLPDVQEKGCHNVVVSDPEWAERMAEDGTMNVILVPDTRLALMALGERYLDDWSGLQKVGVTGSVGKTSTKEFLYSVLSSRYRTGKTPGNLNSEYGIPLTAFLFDEDIEMAVIEMGVGYGSSMADLVQIAKPHHAVVTTVGTSHLEVFGTREKLLEEKLRVSNGFTPENTLVINTDSDLLTRDNTVRHQPADAHIVTVGTSGNEDYILYNVCDNGIDGVECTVVHGAEEHRLVLPVIGAHNLWNATLAIAIGEVYGISMAESIQALSNVASNDNRLDVVRTDDYAVINDTYNASPESMKAGIQVLKHSRANRRIAVLGSMFELGDDSEALHRSVGIDAARQGIDILVTIGENAMAIAEGAESVNPQMAIYRYANREAAEDAVRPMLAKGDLIYVKASRSMALEKFVQAITQ